MNNVITFLIFKLLTILSLKVYWLNNLMSDIWYKQHLSFVDAISQNNASAKPCNHQGRKLKQTAWVHLSFLDDFPSWCEIGSIGT